MNYLKKVLSVLLAVAMCITLASTSYAANTVGVTFSASLDKTTIETSASAQQVVMTVKANKDILADGMGMTVLIPEGWSLAAIENEVLQFASSNVNLANGRVNYATADGENWTTNLIVKVTYNVPANVAVGTYTLGIQELTISKDYGEEWEDAGSASTTLEVKATSDSEAAVSYDAVLDKTTIETSASAQQVVMTVKANKDILVDGMGMTVLIPEGWSLAAIENEVLQFASSNVNLANGRVNYATADGENWTTNLIVKVTYNVPANVAVGTYTLGIQELTISKDYGEEWESNGTASVMLTVSGVVHTCTHDHYDITEITHQSICACGRPIGEVAAHTGGKATCTKKAECETCGAAYGEVNKENHGETEIRDAVTETCGKPGYTGDTYCKDCGEKIATGKEIPATGAHVDADGKWEHDENGHFHTCGCGAKFEEAAHTGGKATCTKKAECETCGAAYGEVNKENHGETEIRDAVTETCGKPGYTGDTYCKDCGEKIATGKEIPATGAHVDADGKWEHDENGHFHTCGCGAKFEEAAHTGGKATCTKKAECETCGAAYGEVNKENHGDTEIRDAVTETCGKPGYTGDTYCKDCGEKIATGKEIPATGAHVDADGKWEHDENGHFHTCGCGAKFEEAAHTGGKATCTKKAECETCGAAYGEVNKENHGETEIRDAVTETCGKPGYTGDTYCKDCGEKIATGKEIPATGAHVDADGKWEHDENGHFHTCGCGAKFEEAAHTGGKATCTKKAECETCGAAYGEVNKENHGETEIRDAVTETCGKPGYTGDTYCKDCGEKIATGKEIPATGAHVDADGKWEHDENGHFHTCGCGAKFEEAAHTGGKATCTKKAECETCGAAYGEVNKENHGETEIRDAVTETCGKPGYTGDTYCKDCGEKIATGKEIPATGAHVDADGKWEHDENGHFHTCGCGAKFEEAAHTGGKATCTKKAECETCGAAYGEVNKENHGETEIRDAVTETCGKPGYTGDTYCKDCGEKIATGKEIPATGKHTYGEWVTIQEPTDTENGVKEKTCSGCGDVVSEIIPAQGSSIPDTGDNMMWLTFVMATALLALGAVLSLKKKNV